MTPLPSPAGRGSTSFLRDLRFLHILAQAALVAFLLTVGWILANNVITNLRASNIPMGWGFLGQAAGFEISEGPAFDPSQSYLQAFRTGVVNTLRVIVAGIVLATLLGLTVGIARLSSNWLVRSLAGAYVEIIRNTPLLVQLFFWYFAVILQLPTIQNHIGLGDVLMISNRGMAMAWPYATASVGPFRWWLLGALIVAVGAWAWRRAALRQRGRLDSAAPAAFAAFLLVAVIGFFVSSSMAKLPPGIAFEINRGDRGSLFVDRDGDGTFSDGVDQPLARVPVTLLDAAGEPLGSAVTDGTGAFRFFNLPDGAEGVTLQWETPDPVIVSLPQLQGFNVRGGRTFSPEYTALLLGLVIYAGAFIAEIVRAGINAVPKGQWEASRAVGLSAGDTLRLIVLPQALRVIIPPLTSQYLNLAKNSSLAIAVGYPDLFNVSLTIMNQAGATVQMFLLIMATYLTFSLITSLLMNWYNRRMALVER